MVAFDHLRLKLSYFEWAYHLLDIYRKVFTNEDVISDIYTNENDEEKT
jgi:hypothetical protein